MIRESSVLKMQEISYNMPPAKVTFQEENMSKEEYMEFCMKKDALDRKIAKFMAD